MIRLWRITSHYELVIEIKDGQYISACYIIYNSKLFMVLLLQLKVFFFTTYKDIQHK